MRFTVKSRQLSASSDQRPAASAQDLPIVNREGWYSLHPLLHSYARHLLASNPQRDEIRRRYEGHIITVAEQFWRSQPEEWQDLDPYLPHIHAVGDGLVEPSKDPNAPEDLLRRAQDFALNTSNYLFRRREVRRLEWLEMGLDVSRRLQDQKRESLFLNELALAFNYWGDKKKALEYYEQALPLRRQVGDKGGEATTLNNIGIVYDALGEKDKALEYYEQALPLLRQVGNRSVEAITSYNIGLIYHYWGQLEEAIGWVARCVELDEQVQSPYLKEDSETLARWRAELAQKVQGENEG